VPGVRERKTVTVSDFADIVAALRAVPGIADADVEPDAEGSGLGLLRLGLTPGVDEVQVATRVGRLLREQFGLCG
jgi:chromate transport protein ChrA